MSVAFLQPADLAEWIKNHTVSKRKPFLCFGARFHYYLLEDPDPDMKYWFGYNPFQDAFFISDNIATSVSDSILCMECGRLNFNGKDKSRLSAAQRIITGPKTQNFKRLKNILCQFYQEYAAKFEPLHELTSEQQDIIATAKYLENLKG